MQQLMQTMATQPTIITTTLTDNRGPLDILLGPLVILQGLLVILVDSGLQETLPPTTLIKLNTLEPILELTHLPILHHTPRLQLLTLVPTLHHHPMVVLMVGVD